MRSYRGGVGRKATPPRIRGLKVAKALVLIGVIVFLPSSAARAAGCTTADALLELHLLEPARDAYLSLLDQDQPPACAITGFETTAALQRAAQGALQTGRDEEAIGDDAAALAAYTRAIEIDRSLQPAIGALEALVEKLGGIGGGEPYAAALALFDAGYIEEAQESARQVVLDDPDAAPIPAELQDPSTYGWGRVASVAAALTKWIIAVIPLVLGAVAIVLLLLRPVGRWHRLRWLRVRWPFNKIFPSEYQLSEIADPNEELKLGSTLTAILAHELAQVCVGGGSIKRVVKPEVPSELPDLDLGPQLKFLGPLIRWFRTPDRLTVVGQIHAPSSERSGLSVAITTPTGKVLDGEMFIGPGPGDPPSPRPYFELATKAGAWAVFAIHRNRPPRDRTDLKLVGTSDALSYGSFRAGVLLLGSDQNAARRHFLDALDRDASNLGAMINLAVIVASETTKTDAALALLREARRIIEDPDVTLPADGVDSPLWYQTRYLEAAALLNRFTANRNAGRIQLIDLEEARGAAVDAIANLGTRLAPPPRRPTLIPWRRVDDRSEIERQTSLRLFLESVEPVVVTLLASVQAEAQRYGLPIGPTPDPAPTRPAERYAWFNEIDEARPPPGNALVHSIEFGTRRHVSYDAQYNLACYYTRAERFDDALEALSIALAHPSRRVLDWARDKDPVLHSLRTDPRLKNRFAAVIRAAEESLQRAARAGSAGEKKRSGWTLSVNLQPSTSPS